MLKVRYEFDNKFAETTVSSQDQVVIMQSLESELMIRIEADTDLIEP